MAHVKVNVNADGAGFYRTMQGIENRVHGLQHQIGHGLKEAFVGLVGAGSVGLLVENMVSYAESITRASERLGIATNRIQELRVAARHMGVDLEYFDGVFRNLDKNASAALNTGSKQANAAKRLGLTESDLKHLNKSDLLNKALKGTAGMGRTEAETLLGQLVGTKNAGRVYGSKEDILSGKGTKVSNEELAALVEFKHSLEDVADIVRVALIPALTSLIEWVTNAIGGLSQGNRTLDEMQSEAQSIYAGKHNGESPNAAKEFVNRAAFSGAMAVTSFNPFMDDEAKKAKIKALQLADIRETYGKDVADELMKTFKPSAHATVLDNLKEAQAARRKEREEEQAKLNGPVDRVAPVKKDETPKELLGKELAGNNPFLKVGGLLGVDAGYRLQRLTQETNNLLRQIVKNTSPDTSSEFDPEEWGNP